MSEFIDQDDPKMEDLNLREERVKESEDSTTQGVSVAPASCSAITEASNKTDASSSRNRDDSETGETTMVDKEDDRDDGDDPKLEDINLQEGSNPELCDDGAAQESQVKDTEEDTTPIVFVVPASCSAITEANEKTNASSSRNHDSSETGETTMVDKEDDRNDGDDEYEPKSDEETSSLVTQLPEEIVGLGTQPHRSDSNTSPLMTPPQENVGFSSLVTQPSHQNPRVDQITMSGQTMNPQQQQTRPHRGSAMHASYQNNFRQPLGMQQHPMANQIPNVVPMQSQMFYRGTASEPWRPVNTYHQHPMAYQFPNVVPMQSQMFIRGPASEPWRPVSTYHQHPMAYQFPNVVPMQTQMFYGGRASTPWGPHNTYQQHPMANQIPNVVPMQTQMFNRGPAPEIWRVQIRYQQDPTEIQRFMPWHVLQQLGNSQMRPFVSPMPAAMISEGHVIEQRLLSRGMRPRQEANQQNWRFPQLRSENLVSTITPDGQRRTGVIVRNSLNPQDRHFVFIDAVYVEAPLAEVNRLVQLNTQTQQPTQSQEVDVPGTSEQGRDQQQPPTQSQEVDGPASSEQGEISTQQQQQPR